MEELDENFPDYNLANISESFKNQQSCLHANKK